MPPQESTPTDERQTPWEFWRQVDDRFHFDLDVAATAETTMCDRWLGPGSPIAEDAFAVDWRQVGRRLWMNPPYSQIPAWLAKARAAARGTPDGRVQGIPGAIVVCLLPSNTSARWFHEHVWDERRADWHPWVVEVRFHPHRLTFAPHTTSAMWPSMLVVF
jgi:phage N-6-adenine-methyltransferase